MDGGDCTLSVRGGRVIFGWEFDSAQRRAVGSPLRLLYNRRFRGDKSGGEYDATLREEECAFWGADGSLPPA